jgi:hypothetical protein
MKLVLVAIDRAVKSASLVGMKAQVWWAVIEVSRYHA